MATLKSYNSLRYH